MRLRRGARVIFLVSAVLVAVPSALALEAQSLGAQPLAAQTRAAQSSSTVAVHVKPGTGKPSSTFSISFKLPSATGVSGDLRRTDSVSVIGPRHSGCLSSADQTLPSGLAGRTVAARLVPAHLGGHWCIGTFRGSVTETQTFECRPIDDIVCPQIVIAPETIGHFRFKVTRRG